MQHVPEEITSTLVKLQDQLDTGCAFLPASCPSSSADCPPCHRWDTLRNPGALRALLRLVYADDSAVSDALLADMLAPTAHPAAAAAFASILFAPRGLSTFGRNLQRIAEHGLPACLVYGGDDPWIGPLWGARAKRAMPAASYYELSPAGHCPHHEVPEVVNELLREWMHSTLTGGPPPLHEERQRTWALPPRKDAASGAAPRQVVVRLREASPTSPVELVEAAWRAVVVTWRRLAAARRVATIVATKGAPQDGDDSADHSAAPQVPADDASDNAATLT
eukprot:SM000063S20044  [mRNA]  locus=s63:494967:497651:+ [translate_table: standard]